MKKAILFLLVTLLPAFVMAQKSSDDIYYVPPKKDYEAIKAAKETNNAMLYEQALKALEEQKFILNLTIRFLKSLFMITRFFSQDSENRHFLMRASV